MSSRAVPAHKHATLLGVATLLLIAIVVAASFLALQATDRGAARLVQRDDPALALLYGAAEHLDAAEKALGTALEAASEAHRDEALATVVERQRLAAADIVAFRERSDSTDFSQTLAAWPDTANWSRLVAELPERSELSRGYGRLLDELGAMRSALGGLEQHVLRVKGERLARTTRALRWFLALTLLLALGIGAFVTWRSARAIHDQHAELLAEKRERELEATRREFDGRLHRALELVRTEANALEVVHGALSEVALPAQHAEMLLADSSMAHLERVVETGPAELGGCDVLHPQDCPAIRRNAPMSFANSARFDVCPHLKHRATAACSALCMPLSIMGRTAGVLHVVAPVDRLPDQDQRRALQSIAAQAGDEIGLMRAFASKERQANTDTLTGLRNRRSLESKLPSIVAEQHYTVAFVDIDHFKRLNDTHGHETGDRALRLFADVVRASLRPADYAARWGGEEFVIVLPKVTGAPALRVLKRLREVLAQRLTGGTVPAFTVSMGVSDSLNADTFDAIVQAVDEALLLAKREGRDRIVYAPAHSRGRDSNAAEPTADRPDADVERLLGAAGS